MSKILKQLKNKILVLDGSMGALLQDKGLPPGYAPDIWNIEKPNIIKSIHAEYVRAGSNIILTNTFGASRLRLREFGEDKNLNKINKAAVANACAATKGKSFIAGDIGPCGTTIEPFGELPFKEAVKIFKEQVKILVDSGVDLISIETMFDLQEMKAAVIAAKEVGKVPIMAMMTFTKDLMTDTGTDPETAAVALEGLDVDIIGTNCSTGPEHMLPAVEKLAKATDRFISVQPNAGLPVSKGGKTIYPASADEVALYAKKFVQAGANIIGGCCGTTPEYIKLISKILKNKVPKPKTKSSCLRITSRVRTAYIGSGYPFFKIGEKINPTGKKAFAESIKEGKTDLIVTEARKEFEAGADALDVNVGVPMIDEPGMMAKAIAAVQNVVDIPLVIDSSNTDALEQGLINYTGKALVNSVNAEDERLERILPIVKKYGAAVIGLTAGDEIPEKAKDRLKSAKKILKYALKCGISKEDIIFDCLALVVSAMQNGARETLNAIHLIKTELGAPVILGISNVSFGLPSRKTIHNTFMGMAISRGLDAAIINPYDPEMHKVAAAASLFAGRDIGCKKYIDLQAGFTETEEIEKKKEETHLKIKGIRELIYDAVLEGEKDSIQALVSKAVEKEEDPFELFVDVMTPALHHLGDLFAKRKKFIPHLVTSADTMKRGVDILKPLMEKSGKMRNKGTIVFATVKGDIHDIGKNVCVIMLGNFGYNVIDLGKNIPCEDILKAVKKHKAHAVALSALMTTTMMQMKEVIDSMRKESLNCKVMVGGAVVTKAFAKEIGADGYSKDVGDIVSVTESLI
jgi:5-methyltetrahydrofolate--homocysteine methyltransferase